MLAGVEHSCAMSCLKKGIPLIVPNKHYVDLKALMLQSVSPLYNAQQGGSDVADARGGVWDSGVATTQHRIFITRVK
jgi:mannitol-specific phosphotransferase system IIBC component